MAILPLILSRTDLEFRPTIFCPHVGSQLSLYRTPGPKYSPPNKLIRFAFGYKRLISNPSVDLYLDRLQALLGPGGLKVRDDGYREQS
mgnify:FL=1